MLIYSDIVTGWGLWITLVGSYKTPKEDKEQERIERGCLNNDHSYPPEERQS